MGCFFIGSRFVWYNLVELTEQIEGKNFMSNSISLKEVIAKFSEHVHRTYFSNIPSNDWSLINRNNGYNFGYKAGEYFRYDANPPHKIEFSIFESEGLLQFRTVRGNKEDQLLFPKISDDFYRIFNESGIDALLCTSYSSVLDPLGKETLNLYPFGEKAKKVIDLVQLIRQRGTFDVVNYGRIMFHTKSYSNRKNYEIIPDLSREQPILTIRTYLSKTTFSMTVSTKEQLVEFLTKLEIESAFFQSKEQEIISLIKQYDVTCYYNEQNGSLYIYNERVPFHIAQIHENGKTKYRVRFSRSYHKGVEIEPLMEKVKQKALAHLKKNRMKAAVRGNASDVISKFLFKLTGYQTNDYVFHKLFKSTYSEGDLNKKLLGIIEEEMTPLNDFYCAYYQLYSRSQGNRHRIKYGKKLNDVYAFVAASAIFIISEEEFKQIQLEEKHFKQKKDRVSLVGLNEWKATI